jgi:hypothetical protein
MNRFKESDFDLLVRFESGKVDRRFADEWSQGGFINIERLPDLVGGVLQERREMIGYIEALHDKIDWILEKNQCCDVPSCLSSRCTSDHK